MPKLDNEMVNMNTGSFQFSAIRPESLGATEYTLVTIALDVSGSVASYSSDLDQMAQAVVNACKKSPRAENLMMRRIDFNQAIREVHGFKPLSLIDAPTYPKVRCGGNTNLFGATYSAIASTIEYGKTLAGLDFSINGIIFVITDGDDNVAEVSPLQIKNQMQLAVEMEEIESLLSILIGINDAGCKSYLDNFKRDADLSQYISVGDATAQKLAKLANFVSQSISSQSQSLGSGGPSQLLTF